MRPEEQKKILAEILNNREDQGKVSDLLTALSDDYGVINAEHDLAIANANKLKADNESLRDTNMRLFLKVGVPAPEEKTAEPEAPAPDFAELWKKKG